MATLLILTEEIIDSFNNCIEERNYRKFLENHQEFIKKLVENLKKTKLPNDELCRIITQNAQTCLDYLASWDLEYPKTERSFLKVRVPEFHLHLYEAVFFKNWETFYIKYRPKADFIISQARSQNTMDLRIEFKSALYENFVSRDLAASNFKRSPSFNTSSDIMENFMEQKLRALESRIEKSVEQILEGKISSLKAEVEQLKNHQKLVESHFDQRLQLLEKFIMTKLEALKTVVTRELDEKLKLLETKLGHDMELSCAEMKHKLNIQAEEVLLETIEKTNYLRSTTNRMAIDIEALDWKCSLLMRERLQEDTSSDSPNDLDDSNHSDSGLEAQDHEGVGEESDDNDSIRRMEEEFQKDLATLNQINEEELRRVREQRAEMNREAEKERNQIFQRLGSLRFKK